MYKRGAADTEPAWANVVYVQVKAHTCVMMLSKMVPGWRGGEKLLSKVAIFVFFAHKKYSRSFVKVRLNHWCHMDYFNDVLILRFCAWIVVPLLSMEGQKALRFHQKYLNLCSED